MSEWKEDANKRRDIRQCKNLFPQVINRRKIAIKKDRFAVEMRSIRSFFFERSDRWQIHKKYSSRAGAEQAISQLDTQYLSEDYEKRIIEL